MSSHENAQRLTAWQWAAESLGIETTPQRLAGLVELTAKVRAENLKPAIAEAIRANPSSFLPPVSAVIEAGHRIAGKRREAAQARLRDARRGQALIEAQGSRATPEEIEQIRERIGELARGMGMGNVEGKTVHGWRPEGAIKQPADDSAGIAAARAARFAREASDG